MTNIYVGNLPYATEEDDLVEYFSRWGQVGRATLVFDRETGRPRGFGFVEMVEAEDARKAIEEAHGEELNGRPLTVNEARPRGSGRGSNLSAAAQGGPSASYKAAATPESSGTGRGYSNSSPAASTPKKPKSSEQAESRPAGGGYSNYLYS